MTASRASPKFITPPWPATPCFFSPVVRLVHDYAPDPAAGPFAKDALGDHALHYFAKGTGTYRLRGIDHAIRPGTVFLVRPGEGYRFDLSSAAPARMFNIHFDIDANPAAAHPHPCPADDQAGKARLPECWPSHAVLAQPKRYADVFFALMAAGVRPGGPDAPLRIQARLLDLLALLAENDRQGPQTAGAHETVQRAIALLREDLARDWTLSGLAARAGVGRSRLCQLFRRHAGTTVRRFLERERLQKARYLLLYTDLPVKVIAARCGFVRVQHFSRVFREGDGLPPAAFRHRHRETEHDG